MVVGIETLAGYVASLDDLGKGMAIGSSINRVGPGVGASAGGCFIFITGVTSPAQLNGHQQGDWDFNVSLGGNWSKAAQAAGKAKKLKPLIDALAKIGAKTPGGLKSALKAHPDKWVEPPMSSSSTSRSPGSEWRRLPFTVSRISTPSGISPSRGSPAPSSALDLGSAAA